MNWFAACESEPLFLKLKTKNNTMRQLKITQSITNRDANIDRYFIEIERFSVLSAEDEIKLSKKIKAGCKESKDKLINHNLRFVVSVAKKYSHNGVELSDLIAAGNIGLVIASERFDATRGFKFISYAISWIRQSIIEHITSFRRSVRVPQNINNGLRKVINVSQKYEHELSIQELTELTGLTETQIRSIILAKMPIKSMEESLIEDVTIGDTIGQDYEFGEIENARLLKQMVVSAIDTLCERDATILKMAFGIGYDFEYNLADISKAIGCTKESVRQRKEKALKKLQRHGALKSQFALCV